MTSPKDKIALDAAKAAELVRQTAEATATALNISYIQKDVAEIKETVKEMNSTQDDKILRVQNQIAYLQKVVYMGLGGITVLSFLLRFFIK